MSDAPSSLRSKRALHHGFLNSVRRFPERPALDVGGAQTTYAELHRLACGLGGALEGARRGPGRNFTAVLGHRSRETMAGVLAALFRGHAYVPLNADYPLARTLDMLARTGATEIIVDEKAQGALHTLLPSLTGSTTFALPHLEDTSLLAERWPAHRFLGARECARASDWEPRSSSPAAPCYVLFTSGSTGTPKGVVVTHENVAAFLDSCNARYRFTPEDRFSQTFELTFDLSVFDLFAAWQCGGCVCCPSDAQMITPGRYIEQAALSVWFSVPSAGAFMRRMGALKPGQYPGLRLVLFCGEGLPVEVAAEFASAAPNAIVENLYGPTELTLACTVHRFEAESVARQAEMGLVPIGECLPGMRAIVVDETLRHVAPGSAGELLVTGPQLSAGYLDDPVRTGLAFVRPPGEADVFYRTGDRVRRPSAAGEPLVFLGRNDSQVKIRGFRVELGEVEAALRAVTKSEAAVVPWPRAGTSFEGLVGFVLAGATEPGEIFRQLRQRLPAYMMPNDLHVLREFPLNANGKIDRGALARKLAGD